MREFVPNCPACHKGILLIEEYDEGGDCGWMYVIECSHCMHTDGMAYYTYKCAADVAEQMKWKPEEESE